MDRRLREAIGEEVADKVSELLSVLREDVWRMLMTVDDVTTYDAQYRVEGRIKAIVRESLEEQA